MISLVSHVSQRLTDSSERMKTLRAELQRQGLSGFIIPHADEYQNEYLPPCAERLAWLTGFSGSAGTAVVLQDEAAIFVDGRYILQVQNQVDPKLFVSHNVAEWPVHEWLASVLKKDGKVGYDPWLHTPKEVDQFRTACERSGAELVTCVSNPLDAVWVNRPDPPSALAIPHYLGYAGKASAEKREDLARKLKSDRVDVAILTAPDSIAWLLNIRGNDVPHTPLPLGFAFLRRDASVVLFMDDRKLATGLVDYLGPGVTIHPLEEFGHGLDELGGQRWRVVCHSERSASWIFDRLAQAGAEVIKGEDPCALPKACKNPIEIAGAREAHKRDGAAVCRFLAWMAREAPKGHLTEMDAQAYLDARRQENTLWRDVSFPTISAAGPNGAIVHYRATEATNRRIEPGSLYLVDSGAQYLDGTTDITRTIAIGTPTSEHRDRYTRVLKGHITLATARFPKGTSGGQLDALARKPLWDIGLDYDHGTGHGVGSYLGVHEGPQRISKTPNSVALEPGMILSNEPGYYKAGEYGIRIENLLVVIPCTDVVGMERTLLAFETLTLVPFDLSLIEPSLLTPSEIEWVNAYHVRVRETVTPLVDADTASWLQSETAPI